MYNCTYSQSISAHVKKFDAVLGVCVHFLFEALGRMWNSIVSVYLLSLFSLKICCHIYNFGCAYKDIDNILSNGHTWNHWNLKGYISKPSQIFYSEFQDFLHLLTPFK